MHERRSTQTDPSWRCQDRVVICTLFFFIVRGVDVRSLGAYPLLSVGDLLYLAGLFDGEGHANVYACGPNKSNLAGRIQINMIDRDPIAFFAFAFNAHCVGQYSKTKIGKPVYTVQLTSRKALRVAQDLLPYVKNESKVRQLRKITSFYENRQGSRELL